MANSHLNRYNDEHFISDDRFDSLPDPIVLLILSNVLDSTSLARCLLVSCRFASLVPLVDSISITVPSCSPCNIPKPRHSLIRSFLLELLCKLNLIRNTMKPITHCPVQLSSSTKPHNAISRSKSSSPSSSIDVYEWISNQIKNFERIRSVRLELPCHGVEFGHDQIPLITWTAEFGSQLRSCVILGADSITKLYQTSKSNQIETGSDDRSTIDLEDRPISNETIKSRVLWIISSLLSASARHSLISRVATECPDLEEAEVADLSAQGTLKMTKDDFIELRRSISADTDTSMGVRSWERSCVPDVVIRMRYVEEAVELPAAGCVMRGATLMAVAPAEKGRGGEVAERLLTECGEEGKGLLGEAARVMERMKGRKICKLEMNSF
ncbi:hypothetical protein Droror1_Dr00023371 [Drosera rotundifolia]